MSQTLYYNGTILTMEDSMPQAEAVLTENGRILETGSWEKVRDRAKAGARRADLEGRVLMPGFIDSHSHFTACASHMMEADLGNAESFEDIVEIIRSYIAEKKIPQGKWVTAAGYDHNRLREREHPARKLLDMASPRNPLILKHQSGHMGVFNTMALNLLDVTAQTEAPQGGMIEKENGLPTGYMEENAFLGCQAHIPMPSAEDFLEAYGQAQEMYASYGITTVQEGMMTEQLTPLYQMLLRSKLLRLDLVSYMDINQSQSIKEAFSGHIRAYKGHMKIGGYKMFLDGSPQGRTAWMRAPYERLEGAGEPADYRGYNTLTDSQVRENILRAERENMQLLAHCNGDMAASQYLDQLEAAYRELAKGGKERWKGKRRRPGTGGESGGGADGTGGGSGGSGGGADGTGGGSVRGGFYPGDIRPVMIHAQLLGRDQLERVKLLKVIPSFFLAHVYHWGEIHVKNFGPQRASRISPAGSALRAGIPFTLHQDSPVIRPDMLATVWCAAARQTREGRILGPEERIPVLEALKAVTVNGAYQYFEENEKGSIVKGKKADFVILDRNPLEVRECEIRDIRVLATVKEDRILWKA